MTPWLFTDELELTQLARAVAETGHAARRGAAHSPDTLYTYLIAPAWWLGNTHASYDAVKYIGVLVMASALFPTYFFARLDRRSGRCAVRRRRARPRSLPSPTRRGSSRSRSRIRMRRCASFSSRKRLVTRGRWWWAAAVLACAIAPAVRGELVVIAVSLVLAAIFMAWSSPPLRARRAAWSIGDWVGRRRAPRRRALRDQRRCEPPLAGVVLRDDVLQAPHRSAWATGRPARSRSASA